MARLDVAVIEARTREIDIEIFLAVACGSSRALQYGVVNFSLRETNVFADRRIIRAEVHREPVAVGKRFAQLPAVRGREDLRRPLRFFGLRQLGVVVQRRLQNDILVVQIPCRVHDVDQRCAARVVHHVEIVTLRYAAFRAVGGGDLQKRSALRRARVQLLAEIAEGVVLHVLLVQPAETAEIDAEIPLFGIRIHKGDARRVLSVRRDGDRTVVFADERAVRLYLVRFAAVKD